MERAGGLLPCCKYVSMWPISWALLSLFFLLPSFSFGFKTSQSFEYLRNLNGEPKRKSKVSEVLEEKMATIDIRKQMDEVDAGSPAPYLDYISSERAASSLQDQELLNKYEDIFLAEDFDEEVLFQSLLIDPETLEPLSFPVATVREDEKASSQSSSNAINATIGDVLSNFFGEISSAKDGRKREPSMTEVPDILLQVPKNPEIIREAAEKASDPKIKKEEKDFKSEDVRYDSSVYGRPALLRPVYRTARQSRPALKTQDFIKEAAASDKVMDDPVEQPKSKPVAKALLSSIRANAGEPPLLQETASPIHGSKEEAALLEGVIYDGVKRSVLEPAAKSLLSSIRAKSEKAPPSLEITSPVYVPIGAGARVFFSKKRKQEAQALETTTPELEKPLVSDTVPNVSLESWKHSEVMAPEFVYGRPTLQRPTYRGTTVFTQRLPLDKKEVTPDIAPTSAISDFSLCKTHLEALGIDDTVRPQSLGSNNAVIETVRKQESLRKMAIGLASKAVEIVQILSLAFVQREQRMVNHATKELNPVAIIEDDTSMQQAGASYENQPSIHAVMRANFFARRVKYPVQPKVRRSIDVLHPFILLMKHWREEKRKQFEDQIIRLTASRFSSYYNMKLINKLCIGLICLGSDSQDTLRSLLDGRWSMLSKGPSFKRLSMKEQLIECTAGTVTEKLLYKLNSAIKIPIYKKASFEYNGRNEFYHSGFGPVKGLSEMYEILYLSQKLRILKHVHLGNLIVFQRVDDHCCLSPALF
mmetsp:Transcript_33483/g.42756  ORF Transcript_33483/g.42756 Transcript_33483/m.42756 type:complete len:759 (-) Transcript_33483:139-2415(-)